MLVRVNVAFSLLRGGRVAEAEEVVGTPAGAPFDVDRWPLHTARAVIDSRRGLAGTAMARLEEIWAEPSTSAPRDLEFLVWASDVAWWAGAAESALARLVPPLTVMAGSAPVRLLAPTLLMAARAAAGVGDRDAIGAPRRHGRSFRAAGRGTPPRRTPRGPSRCLHRRTGRLDPRGRAGPVVLGGQSMGHPPRPARSRLLPVASGAGRHSGRQGHLAARLLTKAAADAREHVPLSEAIAATAAGAR